MIACTSTDPYEYADADAREVAAAVRGGGLAWVERGEGEMERDGWRPPLSVAPVIAHWTALPPMPQPKSAQMRSEACWRDAIIMILGSASGHTPVLVGSRRNGSAGDISYPCWRRGDGCAVCLLGLLFAPGTLRRSGATYPGGCDSGRLLQGKPTTRVERDENPEHSARCLLWRGARRKCSSLWHLPALRR